MRQDIVGFNKNGAALDWTPYTSKELFFITLQMSIAGLEPGHISGAEWCKPSFYDNALLVRTDDKQSMFIYADDEMHMLKGTGRDIVEAAEKAGLNLTPENAIDYITYFSENILGDGEPFKIVHEGDILKSPDGADMKIEKPSRIEALSLRKHFMKAMVVHSGHLFHAIISCDDEGAVNMVDDNSVGPVIHQPARDKPAP